MRDSRRTRASLNLVPAGLALLICLHPVIGASASEFERADRVIVKKSERVLLLMKADRVLRSMEIVLGLAPKGHKFTEGDFRTPEGSYVLTERNPASDFFLSINISYPSARDMREAQLSGLSPGGQIMIHGQPNDPRHSDEYYQLTDWTDGCIAVSNSDMVDIWLMTNPDTQIQILP
jgi:murein L,D-transpeptidase YafK